MELVATGRHWSRVSKIVIGGRRALAGLAVNAAPLGDDIVSDTSDDLGFFHRDRSVSLLAEPVSIQAGAEYALDLQVQGRGAIRLWLRGYAGNGTQLARFMFGDTFLSGKRPMRNLGHRFRVPRDWSALAVELEHLGSSRLSVPKATLIELRTKPVAQRTP